MNRKVFFVLFWLSVIVLLASVRGDDGKDCQCESKTSLRTKAGVKAASASLLGAFGFSALGSSTIGFTVAGIAKGSIAAYIQAKIGIFAGFSLLQSLGATGGFLLGGPIGLGVAGAIGAATYYWTSSGIKSTPEGCSCDEASTEEDLTNYLALQSIESCIEPGTSKKASCSGRGECEYNKEDDELLCVCQQGFGGTYCEIPMSSRSNMPVTPPLASTIHRCKDEFTKRCIQCWIHKFTKDQTRNCYEHCNWSNRPPQKTLTDAYRPEVGALEMKRVPKLSVIEGSECEVHINERCRTTFKYIYEHTDDHLDQLVVYYSSEEAVCDIYSFNMMILIFIGTFLTGVLAWLCWKFANKMHSVTFIPTEMTNDKSIKTIKNYN